MLVSPSEGMPTFGTADSRDLFPDFFGSLFSRAANRYLKHLAAQTLLRAAACSWNLLVSFPSFRSLR
jgi:hypothetical protein